VNTVTASFNTIMGQMTEMSQRKKTTRTTVHWLQSRKCYGSKQRVK